MPSSYEGDREREASSSSYKAEARLLLIGSNAFAQRQCYDTGFWIHGSETLRLSLLVRRVLACWRSNVSGEDET